MAKRNRYENRNYGKCLESIYSYYRMLKKTGKTSEEAFEFLRDSLRTVEDSPFYQQNMQNFVCEQLKAELEGNIIHVYIPRVLTELFMGDDFENLIDAAKLYMKEFGTDLYTNKFEYTDGKFVQQGQEINKAEMMFLHAEGIPIGIVCRVKYEVKTDKLSLKYCTGFEYAELSEDIISRLDLATDNGKTDKNVWTFVLNVLSFLLLFGNDVKKGLPKGVKADWPSPSTRITLLFPERCREKLNNKAS